MSAASDLAPYVGTRDEILVRGRHGWAIGEGRVLRIEDTYVVLLDRQGISCGVRLDEIGMVQKLRA